MESDISFAVGGLTCAACVKHVEKEVKEISGVEYVSVSLFNGKGYAATNGIPQWDDVAAAVTKAGYKPLREVPSDEELEAQTRKAGSEVMLSWAVAIPAMILMIIQMAGVELKWLSLAEFIAGFFILAGPCRRIFRGAWIALSHKHANMDVLVAIGTVAAWSTSILSVLGLPVHSFGALAPMLPAFHLTGRLIEAKLQRRAGQDLRALMSTGTGMVRVMEDSHIREVPVEAVKEGSLIQVRTGERIPLDGRVTKGGGAVSEAMITGEPIPVSKNENDEVIGGTVLENGLMELEVLRTGEDAFLTRMLTLVEQAQGVQVPLQALADRLAGIFVPIIFGISLVVFAGWVMIYPLLIPFLERAAEWLPWIPLDAGAWTTAVFAAVSLLVVACPCALGLATPMAVSVGSGLSARRGLLIKGGEALQTAGELDILLFDKTGTLTVGKPTVVSSELSRKEIAALGALESLSVHPLAKALVEWVVADVPQEEIDRTKVENFEEIAGEGIQGDINGVNYFVGRPSAPPEASDSADKSPDRISDADTVIEMRRNGEPAGRIFLRDPVKEEAGKAVAALKARNIRPVMVTGDAEKTAVAVADFVKIDGSDVRHSLRPEDKLRIVQEFQKKGLRVGMIGDGINDAAALKAADVGFAMAQGTDLSMEAGDVVITRGGLERIVESLELSRLMVHKIKSNLLWAFIYNIIAIPTAAMALVHPLIAEVAMSLSSIGVILNSIDIKNSYKRRRKKELGF